ncbi:T9SS C-terminal target domain-containing protein [Chryseobacterium shandongense]|uniref:T9SS C-terminal target domain-containing protein n=2 Tax=Chryseobacterium shandongense TaxID=1493872 RepID=A0A3G6MRF1_9FLAO|nr:T9SS C-terminal target domain-containing protein [Chryseobacterium shandongense]AZA86567.1 T9SS C-terminal target domain-containing protein [Chryseobacterium shandongense]AZA94979.1 T9SS C-terminal target domain-containing protein [Chryseobacterium shandongense]
MQFNSKKIKSKIMKGNIYSLSILLAISLPSVNFAQSQNQEYIIEELFTRSEGLEINTYALYPDDNFKSDLSIVLYPNPVDDILNVTIKAFQGDKVSYSLMDMSGKLIAMKEEKNSNFTINMLNLLSGVYVLVIQDENSKKSYKIIKK